MPEINKMQTGSIKGLHLVVADVHAARLSADAVLKTALGSLRTDTFLMDKINNHNPAFGYNLFEGFIEEDCVQALEQIINEKFQVEVEAHKRWKQNDDAMHVFAVALYGLM